jgi:hypothetical protein
LTGDNGDEWWISTTVEYSTDGKFPVKTTNALGHSETKTFDAKTGNVLTLTGPCLLHCGLLWL